MRTRIDTLLGLAGPPLGERALNAAPLVSGRLGAELASLLARANGFLAFESALHVLPRQSALRGQRDVESWNSETLWRSEYAGLAKDLFFFAEDVFGSQFALAGELVVTFEPETGSIADIATDLEGWADALLRDYQLLTGFPLAHDWQSENGPLRIGDRLLPKTPFVLGGAFEIGNLYSIDAVEGMRLRANLATQLHDLPDGTSVEFKTVQ